MKNNLTTLLFVLLFLLPFVAKAQDTWQHLDGMPCEETSSITQDEDGFIWIGTRLGLVSYDGYDIKVYRNDIQNPHAFSSCDIKCLDTDEKGNVFAGAFFGFNTFDRHSKRIAVTHFGGDDYIRTVCYNNGEVWIGTNNGLLSMGEKLIPEHYSKIPNDAIMHISKTLSHKLIVVTQKHGVFIIDRNDKCTPIPSTHNIVPRTATMDDKGTLWIGTDKHGLLSVKQGKTTHHPGFDKYVINDILQDSASKGLIIATDNGVFTFPASALSPMLVGKNIQQLFCDRDNNVWASSDSEGVFLRKQNSTAFKTEKRSFTRMTTPIISQFDVKHVDDSVLWKSIPYINSVYESDNGTTYVGSWHDGIFITRDGAIISHMNTGNTPWLKTNSIYSFADIDHERTLIGTWSGIYLMRSDGSGRFIDRIGASNVSSIHTLSTAKTSENDIWLGLVGGIAHIKGSLCTPDKASIKLYTHIDEKGISSPKDAGTLLDKHDETGNYQLGGIFRIVKDRQGRIWACTSEPGLLLYDSKEDLFHCVSTQLGILGDNVHSLDIDREGRLWMTTNYGILCINIDNELNVTEQHLYTQHDGLPTSYYGSTMSTRLGDGSICFLNQSNLVTVRPPRLKDTKTKHGRATVSGIFVNGKSITDYNTDSYQQIMSKHITLEHDQNNLSIRLTTLSFGQENSIRYCYKLDNIDSEYKYTDMGSNNIVYSQLAPGTYTLHYFPVNGHASKKENEQVLTIEILNPLWWRWWARCLYLMLFAIAAYATTRNIIDRNRKKRQVEILKIEKEQLDELYKKKTQFYVKVIHEFLTPLTLMSEMAHDLQKQVRPSLQATLFMLCSHIDRLLEAMNNIVDIKEDTSAREALQKAQEMTLTDREFLQRCTKSVNSHIADCEYSHQTMMADVGASHATLYRKLKALTGMDATSFIRSIRMKSACQILAHEPDIRIGELAERVGYNNPKYFSSCFKNEFGITPSEFQKNPERAMNI